jgi:adenylate cyclase
MSKREKDATEPSSEGDGAGIGALRRLCGFGEPIYDNEGVCKRARADRDVADRLWRALGFPDVPEGVTAFTEDDARALELATAGLADLPSQSRGAAIDLAVHEARIASAHIAGLAETELDAIGAMAPLGFRHELVQEALEHGIEGSRLGWLILYGVRRQLLAAIERRASVTRGEGAATELAMGFVDLVGFTPLSERLEMAEVGRLLSRFESLTFDAVTEAGGRVVKLIGDEAMFACPDAREAVLAGLEILEATDERGLPAARAGIAMGEVLQKGGDYFGPPVNLANRITAGAEVGTLLVDRVAMEALGSEPQIELAEVPPLELKGIGPTPAWAVRRAAGSGHSEPALDDR